MEEEFLQIQGDIGLHKDCAESGHSLRGEQGWGA